MCKFAIIKELVNKFYTRGGMAQLGARLTGSQEVRGSNPLISTKINKEKDLNHVV